MLLRSAVSTNRVGEKQKQKKTETNRRFIQFKIGNPFYLVSSNMPSGVDAEGVNVVCVAVVGRVVRFRSFFLKVKLSGVIIHHSSFIVVVAKKKTREATKQTSEVGRKKKTEKQNRRRGRKQGNVHTYA